MTIDAVDSRTDVDAAFAALEHATPDRWKADMRRMMLMSRDGDVYRFKHADLRRGFDFDMRTGRFSGRSDEGEITTPEEAYEWATS